MGTRDPRVDAYVEKSAEFARPILGHIRKVVHAACPDVEETMKWGFPHFMYHGILCSMAAFKAHCTFGFWKGTLVLADKGRSLEAMGSFGRITTLSDLPATSVLSRYVKQAMKLNAAGVSAPPKRKTTVRKPLRVPAELRAALKANKKAAATFEAFSPSHKREYAEWIAEAKGADTRARRLAQALEWLAAGKSRNWKYERKR